MSDQSSALWYYVVNSQQQGPVAETTLQQLAQNNTVNAGTLVWREGMPRWTPLQETPLLAIVPVRPAAPAIPPPQTVYQAAPPKGEAESLNQMFMWFWILLAASVPLSFLFIGVFTAIGAVVLYCIMLYKFWELVQDGTAQTTPGMAVGLSFVPFFNFYWNFVAVRGLAQDMNRYCRTRGIQAAPISEDLALWFCILAICNIIPYLNFLTGVAALVFQIVLLNNFKNTAVAIINARQNPRA